MNVSAPIVAEVAAPRRFVLPKSALAMGAIAVVVAITGILWLISPRTSESTDNAYLHADSSAVAPRIAGLVSAVLVQDNEVVRAGQPMVRIDTQDYDARIGQAQAAVADAEARVASARAELAALNAAERLAAARVRSVGAGISSADAETTRALADRARYDALSAQGFATRRDAERARADATAATSGAIRSRADFGVAAEEASVTRARRPVLQAQVRAAEAAVLKERAALELARQDLGHTVIAAPLSGVVGNRQVQIGDYVRPGSRLLTLVPLKSLYVVANFKETQTSAMRVGQKATVYVDALDGEALSGTVESFAPGTGSEFALLPFEPGSGNFTKVVQRVGVRIRLDPGQKMGARLRPGLSVTVKVQVR